jgi:hypothetical protein
MKAMFEVPHDPIAAPQAELVKHREKQRVEGNDSAVLHVVADFPAEAAARLESTDTLSNHFPLLLDVTV